MKDVKYTLAHTYRRACTRSCCTQSERHGHSLVLHLGVVPQLADGEHTLWVAHNADMLGEGGKQIFFYVYKNKRRQAHAAAHTPLRLHSLVLHMGGSSTDSQARGLHPV